MIQQAQKTVILQLLLLYLIWGFNWVVMRMANDYFPPVFFVAVRFSIGAIALGMLLVFAGIFAVLGFGAGKRNQSKS